MLTASCYHGGRGMSLRSRPMAAEPVGTSLLFENDRVRVWEMVLPPGASCSPHRHHPVGDRRRAGRRPAGAPAPGPRDGRRPRGRHGRASPRTRSPTPARNQPPLRRRTARPQHHRVPPPPRTQQPRPHRVPRPSLVPPRPPRSPEPPRSPRPSGSRRLRARLGDSCGTSGTDGPPVTPGTRPHRSWCRSEPAQCSIEPAYPAQCSIVPAWEAGQLSRTSQPLAPAWGLRGLKFG